MARFSLFLNGVKIETIDDLRNNYNTKEILIAVKETKALQRWLAGSNLTEYLQKIDTLDFSQTDGRIAECLMSVFEIDENQRNIIVKREAEAESIRIAEEKRHQAIILQEEEIARNAKKDSIDIANVSIAWEKIESEPYARILLMNGCFFMATSDNFYRSSDGITWEVDQELNSSVQSYNKIVLFEKSVHINNDYILLPTVEGSFWYQEEKNWKWHQRECSFLELKPKKSIGFFTMSGGFPDLYELSRTNQGFVALTKENSKCTIYHFKENDKREFTDIKRAFFNDENFKIEQIVFFKGFYIAATAFTGPCGNGKINTFHAIKTSEDGSNFSVEKWSEESPHTFWTKHIHCFDTICFVTVSDTNTYYTLDGKNWKCLPHHFNLIVFYKNVFIASEHFQGRVDVLASEDGLSWKKIGETSNLYFRGIANDILLFYDGRGNNEIRLGKLSWNI